MALAHALPPANTYSLVYSSDLDRARDTAAIVVAKSGGVIHRDTRLRERHFGGRDGELYRAQFKAALFEYGKSTKNEGGLEHYAVPPNGESEVDVKRRLADFFEHRLLADLKELEDLSNSSSNSSSSPPSPKASVLIVAHDYVIRLFTEYLLGFKGGEAQNSEEEDEEKKDGKKKPPNPSPPRPAKNFFGAEVPPASITELVVSFDGMLKDAFEDGEEAITDVVVVRSGDTAHLGALIWRWW